MGEGRRDTGGREDRQRQTHVPVRESLGDQCVRHGGAVGGESVEVLGDVDRRDAQFVGLRDEISRIARGLVRFAGGGPQHLFGELADGLDDHLLLVVWGQVEVVGSARLQSSRGAPGPGHSLELAVGGSDDGEDLLDAVAQTAVERVTQVVPVQELLTDDRGDQRQADVDRGPLVLLQSDGALAPSAFGARADCGECWSCQQPRLVGRAKTVSYSRVRY